MPETNNKPNGRLTARLRPVLFLLGLLAVIVVLGHFISAKKQRLAAEKMAAQQSAPPPVNCALLTLTPQTIHDRLSLPGVVEPWEDLVVRAEVGGAIEHIAVKEGDPVRRGQVIATIETDDYRIALASARSSHALAQAEYQRNQQLYKKNLLPLAQLQASENTLATARAALDKAALQLRRCTITSPLDGIMQRLDAKEGLLINRGDAIARIVQIDQVLAVIQIPESDVGKVRQVAEVEITIQAADKVVKARQHFLAPAPAPRARLFRLELAMANPDKAILPGMFVRADIVKEEKKDVIAIPLYTIISRNDHHYVFVARDGHAVKQPVTTGIQDGWLVEITTGLAQGDQLIVQGQRQLDDGQAIKVITSRDQGAAPQPAARPAAGRI